MHMLMRAYMHAHAYMHCTEPTTRPKAPSGPAARHDSESNRSGTTDSGTRAEYLLIAACVRACACARVRARVHAYAARTRGVSESASTSSPWKCTTASEPPFYSRPRKIGEGLAGLGRAVCGLRHLRPTSNQL